MQSNQKRLLSPAAYLQQRDQVQKNYQMQMDYMARSNLGAKTFLSAQKKQQLNYSRDYKYSGIFMNRRMIQAQKDQLMEEKGIQKDADMTRNRVRNKYEYAVLKI